MKKKHGRLLLSGRPVSAFMILLLWIMPVMHQAQDVWFNNEAYSLYVSEIHPDILRISLVTSGEAVEDLHRSPVIMNEIAQASDFSKPIINQARSVRFSKLILELSPEPLSVQITNQNGDLLQSFTFAVQEPSIGIQKGIKGLFGLGQEGMDYNREHAFHRMEPGTFKYEIALFGSRVPIPFLVSPEGWGIFVHKPHYPRFDLREGQSRILLKEDPEKDVPALDLFFIQTEQPAGVLEAYTRITGKWVMPPKWSLGYMQSHRTLSGPGEIMDVARKLRDNRLPCDALIYLGTGYCPAGWNMGHGSFEFNPETFPNPEDQLRQLTAMHFKPILHVLKPPQHLHGYFPTNPSPSPASDNAASTENTAAASPENDTPPQAGTTTSREDTGFYSPPQAGTTTSREDTGFYSPPRAGTITSREDTGHVVHYWNKHKPLYSFDIAGFWPDIGDALPVESKLARHRMYYRGHLLERPGTRPYALHRTGYAGMQRYGGWIWSGDVYSTWETLREQIALGINCSVSGAPYWGTDIGGFVSTSEYTGEMYVRWFQFAAFCPSFRSHGRSWHLHTPWGWNTGEIGHVENTPNTMGVGLPSEEALHNEDVLPVCRKYLNLRYRLLPYTYTLAWETRHQGMPFIRPMWLYHPGDAYALSIADQYYWGASMLVAPVHEKGAYQREVYLPEGAWYDFWTNRYYRGEQTIKKFVGLEIMPLYIKAGSIIPMDPVRQFTDQEVREPTTLYIYTGDNGSFTLYEDDGKTLGYLEGRYRLTRFSWDDQLRTLTIRPEKRMQDNKPVSYRVVLMPEEIEKRMEYRHQEKDLIFN